MKHFIIRFTFLFSIVIASSASYAQSFEKDLSTFNKIILSPEINLELVKGDREFIKIEYQGVEEDKINAIVNGKTLKIFLDNARITPKHLKSKNSYYWNMKESIYKNAQVTAYVTYQTLRNLQVRGEKNVIINDLLKEDKFTLKTMGQTQIVLSDIELKKLKVVAYGENQLVVKKGKAHKQVFKLFGENLIASKDLNGEKVKTNLYGENKIVLNANEKLKVNAFGESKILNKGDGVNRKGLVLGETKIH
ncbi:MAG: hypothetical protein CMO01_27395 [Thalassobius sp.]|nr:hypothetical protein [Thalassovita sp.]